MFIRAFCVVLVGACSVCGECRLPAAEQPAVVTKVLGRSASGDRIAYQTQAAVSKRLTLDANNGFFDQGAFTATGRRAVPSWDAANLSAHFSELVSAGRSADVVGGAGAARWYVWLPSTGTLRIQIDSGKSAGRSRTSGPARWRVSIDGQSQTVSLPGDHPDSDNSEAGLAKGSSPLEFEIRRLGAHCLTLTDARVGGGTGAAVRRIVLSGPPAENGDLLRARWRPAAVHTGYQCSECPSTKMWVFETQSVASQSSYSPMTTAFGYFGASFDASGRAAGGVNFSMWAASSKATTMPPLVAMPRLLATGNPAAEFSGFGHEGSGVKIRQWEPYDHHPKSVIQALRVETDHDPETGRGVDTYYGYLFDQPADRWILYAVGRRPQKLRRGAAAGSDTTLRVASFCEVPGPPDRQRTGDQVRTIRRRGWFLGETGKWHRVDCQTLGGKPAEWTSKSIGMTADGWLTMSTGGIPMRRADARVCLPVAAMAGELPVYLQPDRAIGLAALPVGFGSHAVSDVTSAAATVRYTFIDAGQNATATLHYGPVDCLTFAPRSLHGTERKGLSRDLFAGQRQWASMSESNTVSGNRVAFKLERLRPASEYFYRVLVVNDEGKSWDFESGMFSTK